MIVAQSDIGPEADENCDADRTDFPEPAEEYGPGDGSEKRQNSREFGRINRESHTPRYLISFDIRKVLCLYRSEDEHAANKHRCDGHEIHRMVGAYLSLGYVKRKESFSRLHTDDCGSAEFKRAVSCSSTEGFSNNVARPPELIISKCGDHEAEGCHDEILIVN
jgi:hypothetical protein